MMKQRKSVLKMKRKKRLEDEAAEKKRLEMKQRKSALKMKQRKAS